MVVQLLVRCARVTSGPLQGSAAGAFTWAGRRERRFSGHRCDEVRPRRQKAPWLWLRALQEEVWSIVTHVGTGVPVRVPRYLDGAVRVQFVVLWRAQNTDRRKVCLVLNNSPFR